MNLKTPFSKDWLKILKNIYRRLNKTFIGDDHTSDDVNDILLIIHLVTEFQE
jgi:hypothetical protein